ncbi:MAG: hypothetical protein JXA67_16200, partial [Micromonosporaceae bacterium]|nr:hypothetical protein [Micromonosporaceae bacterium]
MPQRHEDYAPGYGRRSPRTHATSDAPALSLNGEWRFRPSPTIAAAPVEVATVDLDDSAWDRLPVPAHWQSHGPGAPIYTRRHRPAPSWPQHARGARPPV